MASSKNLFLLVALLFALALLVSSQVAASEESVKSNGVEEVKYGGPGYGNDGGHGGHGGDQGGHGCPHGCCRWCHHRCCHCCGSAHKAPDAEFEDGVKN